MSDTWFMHRHLAQELDSRLAIVRHAPAQIVLAGADGDVSRALLAQRYPQAQFLECDETDKLQAALQARPQNWLNKLVGKTVPQHVCDPNANLPNMAADMLWANLSLTRAQNLVSALENWARALKTNGLLFFSHWGADSWQEVRLLLQNNGINCAAPTLVDMHDLGDMLFHHGFYDPVTDTANVCLQYNSQSSLHQDWQYLDVWRVLQPDDITQAQTIIDDAFAAGALREITLQTIFGHAIRRATLNEGEQLVQFHRRQPE